MNRALLVFLLATLPLLAGEAWPGVPFSEVRAYAWPANKKSETVIFPGMVLGPGVIDKEGALLNADQIKRLRAAVTGKHRAHAVAGCYVPHNAFVFYDADGKPVAFIEVCFWCFGSREEPKASTEWKDLVGLATIFDELNLPMGSFPNLAAFRKDFGR